MRIFVICFAVLVSVLLSFLAYMGFFNTMDVQESKFGPYAFFYKSFTGPYEEVGPLFQEIHDIFKKKGIEMESMAGVYYDDPREVEAAKLRSEVGAFLSREDAQKNQKKLRGSGLKFKTLPRQAYSFTEFPFRNMISVFLGVRKAYPALEEYHKKKETSHSQKKKRKGGFALEVYKEDKILYLLKGP